MRQDHHMSVPILVVRHGRLDEAEQPAILDALTAIRQVRVLAGEVEQFLTAEIKVQGSG